MSPVTIFGKLIGGLTAIWGIMIIALPIGLLSLKFNEEFNDFRSKNEIIERHEKRKSKL